MPRDLFESATRSSTTTTQNIFSIRNSATIGLFGAAGGNLVFDLAGAEGMGLGKNFASGDLIIDPGYILDLGRVGGDDPDVGILSGLISSDDTISKIKGTLGLFLSADHPTLPGTYSVADEGKAIVFSRAASASPPEPPTLGLVTAAVGVPLGAGETSGLPGRSCRGEGHGP